MEKERAPGARGPRSTAFTSAAGEAPPPPAAGPAEAPLPGGGGGSGGSRAAPALRVLHRPPLSRAV